MSTQTTAAHAVAGHMYAQWFSKSKSVSFASQLTSFSHDKGAGETTFKKPRPDALYTRFEESKTNLGTPGGMATLLPSVGHGYYPQKLLLLQT